MKDYAEMFLTKGKIAKVPLELAEQLQCFRWSATESKPGQFYAVRGVRTKAGQRRIYLHRAVAELLGLSITDKQVDHINGDKLDNRVNNLRVASPTENNCNTGKRNSNRKTSSQYKGVYLSKRTGLWCARVKLNGKRQVLGSFINEIAAAQAYDDAARKLHGSFCKVNFS